MSSTVKYIGAVDTFNSNRNPIPDGTHVWDNRLGFGENLSKYSMMDQLRCAIDQALAIAYYLEFYGRMCHELVNEYIDEFLLDMTTRFVPKATREFKDGPCAEIVQYLVTLVQTCRTRVWSGTIDPLKIKDFLDAAAYHATPSWTWNYGCHYAFVPFVMYKNKSVLPGQHEYRNSNLGVAAFALHIISDPVGVPTGGLHLVANNYPIGISFNARVHVPHTLAQVPILDYIAHFNLSDRRLEEVFAIISEFSLHMDMTRDGINSSQKYATALRMNMLGIGCIATVEKSFLIAGLTHINRYFDITRDFIKYVHTTYGVNASDADVMSNIFSCFAATKQQKDSVEYIRRHGGSASADQLQSSQECLGASIEALTFISQIPSLLSAQSQVTPPKAAEEAKNEENKTEPKPAETSDTKKEESKTVAKPEDVKSKGPDKTDDTAGGQGGDDTSSDNDEGSDAGQGADSGDNDDGARSDTSSEGADSSADDTPVEDPEVDTSDDEGFEFSVSSADAETLDSVMFKEEMSSYLKNILANPPDGLSPQNVATLTALQKFWLHCLSIETIMGIVGSCVKRLPKSLITLNTKLYGVKRQ